VTCYLHQKNLYLTDNNDLQVINTVYPILVISPFLGWTETESKITETSIGLLYQLLLMMTTVEQSVEWFAGKTEVLGETCTSTALFTTNPQYY
jgi:hypothetical protein